MRGRLLRIVVVAFAMLACVLPGLAQVNRSDGASVIQWAWNKAGGDPGPSSRIGSGSVMRDKYGFYWETRIEPGTPLPGEEFSTQATTDSTPAIHRVMLDRSGRTYFGYDALVDALPEAHTYRVTFRPLVMTARMAEGLSIDTWSAWVPLAAPRFPLPQTVHTGEILELTLLTNSATKQRIVDYVSIQEGTPVVPGFQRFTFEPPPPQRDFSYATGAARDIASTDVEMRLTSPRVSINETLEESSVLRTDNVTGAFVWFYVPKHGRFVLSLGPHPELGFRKIGEIRGTTLQFTIGADRYSLSAGARIAPGQAAFNLYVLQQPNWKPTYPFADQSVFNFGAADRFESLDDK